MGLENVIGGDDDNDEDEVDKFVDSKSSSGKRRYVQPTQEEMEEYFDSITNHWKVVSPEDDPNMKFTGEIVYEFPTLIDHNDLIGRLYSTIDKSTGKAREKGEDAIRLVVWSKSGDQPVGGRKKTLRIETWKKNLTEKFISIRDEWEEYVDRCPSCERGWLVERSGQYGEFLGCTEYDDCTYTEQIEDD